MPRAKISIGSATSLVRKLTHKDAEVFAVMGNDVNPMRADAAFD
jgi:hypothetical protein